ncbi:MAG TPA: response regulator [Dehalococcoidia bacterium]|nr:response regulator [Dehalococcoidia bacterium]
MRSLDASPRALRLVVVDDHETARAALVRRLSTDPRIAVVADTSSLDAAVRAAAAAAPHAALIDTRRDDDGGIAIVSALAALPDDVRPAIVVYTAYFDGTVWRRSQLAGACDCLLKQIAVTELFDRLSATVRRALPDWRHGDLP